VPKITAYKCPFTKKIFETRSGYRRHLLKLRVKRTDRRHRRAIARVAHQRITAIRDDMSERVGRIRSAAELERFIIDNFHDIAIAALNPGIDRLMILHQMKMHSFEFENVRYSERASNTHKCPRNGVTNWGGQTEGAPRGYPGFSGRMKWLVTGPDPKHDDRFSGVDVSQVLRHIGVHIGTGCPAWKGNIDFQFFVEDFPGIQEEVANAREAAKLEIFNSRLKGNRVRENDIIVKHIRPIGEKETA